MRKQQMIVKLMIYDGDTLAWMNQIVITPRISSILYNYWLL